MIQTTAETTCSLEYEQLSVDRFFTLRPGRITSEIFPDLTNPDDVSEKMKALTGMILHFCKWDDGDYQGPDFDDLQIL